MVAVVTKTIKPKRLKEKEMRLELLNAMRKAGKDIEKDFKATVKTWKHKPKFETAVSLAGNGPSVLVGTDDEIYRYVDEGTKPHIIKPKRATALRFQGGYQAKTSPGVIGSGAGGASGGIFFSRRGVRHPGTKARKFSEAIEKKWRRPFKSRMEDAMSKAAKKSGHSI
jgi:hypothetical protein